MRLTLRTLLAFLDNTLEPSDRRDLEEKVKTSSLATALTERIRNAIAAPNLKPPTPDASSPNEDANTIAEYVDSTLSPELTADLERHCLESEAQLAEVAACHQILAGAEQGVLGEISPELRARIIAAPSIAPPPSAARSQDFASSHGPSASISLSSGEHEMPPDSAFQHENARSKIKKAGSSGDQTIEPVRGLTAEPVPDLTATIAAATKVIREKHIADKRETHLPPPPVASAGVKSRRQLEELGPILSGGRPSRVTPLLVALALCAVFCFVLIQAIQPLLHLQKTKTATAENTDSASNTTDLAQVDLLPNRQTPRLSGQNSGSGEASKAIDREGVSDTNSVANTEQRESLPMASSGSETSATTSDELAESSSDAPPVALSSDPTEDPRVVTPQPSAQTNKPSETTSENPTEDRSVAASDSPTTVVQDEAAPSIRDSIDPASILDRAEAKNAATTVPPTPFSIAPPRILGGVEDDGGLLLTQDGETGQWLSLPPKSSLVAGQVIACPPSFRARLMLDGGTEATLIGPCALRLNRVGSGSSDDPQRLFFTVDFGRFLIMATQGPVQFSLATPATSGRCALLAPGAVAAVSVEYQRAPGEDPLAPVASKCLTTLFAVQNQCDWQPNSADPQSKNGYIRLANGNRWSIASGAEGIVDRGALLPPWTAANDLISTPDEITARNSLVEFVATDKPIEVSLREAVGFRESDVGALAALTLLSLGMPDAYFGPTGILSQPQQRTNWPKLVDALQAFFDRGPPSAAMVGAAAEQGNSAEVAGKIWGLLAGFPPQSLAQGADRLLVELMDDPEIVVRVVATETTKQMTGLDIDYHPEHETTARRSQGLKRWQASQRRGQIVWQDPVAATSGRPRW